MRTRLSFIEEKTAKINTANNLNVLQSFSLQFISTINFYRNIHILVMYLCIIYKIYKIKYTQYI